MRTAPKGNIPCKFKFELIPERKPSVFGGNVNILYIKTIFAFENMHYFLDTCTCSLRNTIVYKCHSFAALYTSTTI